MFVKERMSFPAITIHPEISLHDALNLMHKEHIRRLPVVDNKGKLIGIVSERDLLHAAPSDATSLTVWEVTSLFSKLTVDRIMTRDVITISEDTPIEEAAILMADNKIGGLPVIREGKIVGIITETDLFKVFLELFGARKGGIRLAALVPEVPGELAQLTKAIFDAGGNILALGTSLGESSDNREITIKVRGVEPRELREVVEPLVVRIIDIREMKPL